MNNKSWVPSGRLFVFSYFAAIIAMGTALLLLPWSWNSGPSHPSLRLIDALFIATSAASVTGLASVDVAGFSLFGKIVLLCCIQAGGLGVVTITTLYIAGGKARMSINSRKLVSDYFLSTLEFDPRRIVKKIIAYTLVFELVGALLLWPQFAGPGQGSSSGIAPPGGGGAHGWLHAIFVAIFHAVSAFCNAGFGMYSNNLESYQDRPLLLLTMGVLIVAGGIGFVVMDDIRKRIKGTTRHLQLYTKIVLWTSGGLILFGAVFFAFFEWNQSLASVPGTGNKIVNALFQSIIPRTAGFDAVSPAAQGEPSRVVTMFLMFIGAGSGSTGGGLKVATFFILLLAFFRGMDEAGDLRFGHRTIGAGLVGRAAILCARMAGLLFLSILALALTESVFAARGFRIDELMYEVISAFSTVGLSLNVSPRLSDPGKFIIILTMFAGRVGVIALAFPQLRSGNQPGFRYPKEDVLIG